MHDGVFLVHGDACNADYIPAAPAALDIQPCSGVKRTSNHIVNLALVHLNIPANSFAFWISADP